MNCANCHADIHRRQFGGKCEECHTVRGWRVSLQAVKGHQNRFPLLGAHGLVDCDSCHKESAVSRFSGLSTDCASCHMKDFQSTRAPDHQAEHFPPTCDTCHGMDSWNGAKFDHIRFAGFALDGAHVRLECASCHLNRRFVGTQANCYSCHVKDFASTRSPDHTAAGFSKECSSCHNSTAWPGAKFDHAGGTKFALSGAHLRLGCDSCHVDSRFAGTPQDCYGCHARAFEATQNPQHQKVRIPTSCADCHSADRWQGARFDHALTRFPLAGAHTSVQCTTCHASGKYAGASSACASCHLADYNKSSSPNHVSAGFPQDCSICHVTAQWKGAAFDHNSATKFALTGMHKSTACLQCHGNNQFKETPGICASCHLTAFTNAKEPNHVAAGISRDCAACHTPDRWKGAKFDHSQTKFPLTGAHTKTECGRCHSNSQYAGTSGACVSCHLSAFNSSKNPNHVVAGFPQDCVLCHATTQWTGAKFDHNVATKFVLTGTHTTTLCLQCHANNRFAGIPSDCYSCHQADYGKTTKPNHSSAGFARDCSICHSTSRWEGASFEHGKTHFALTGAHTRVDCASCHVNNRFAGTPTQCAGCHMTDYNRATSPNHSAAGFPQDCTLCHITAQWKGAKFDHNAATRFILTGAHINAACMQCHADARFAGTPSDCHSCHQANYNKASRPNHVSAGFPRDCSICHSTSRWEGATFDHSKTHFTLTGAHLKIDCSSCHVNNRFAGTPVQCSGCHLADYNKTGNPNHVAAGFPQDCNVCHTTDQWKGGKFDHNRTRFPLTGSHTSAVCTRCHLNNQYAGTSTACVSCHLAAFNSTKDPNHVTAGFPQDCVLCHTTVQWKGAKFNHSTTTKFALTGAHTSVACMQCHVNNRFAGTPTLCSGCHLAAFNKTTNPNHAAAGFSQDCNVCHTTDQWKGAKFDHNRTRFPLTGSHTGAVCTRCHLNNQYAGTSTACVSCHLAAFNSTKDPNHVTAGFPQDCVLCHTTVQWKGAKFSHSTATKFALTGAHTSVACLQCHVNNRFAGTPTLCSGCHLAVYNKSTNPNHVAAGFPQDCGLCHTTTQWKGATFNHSTATKFALTGSHISVTCAQCHVNNKYAGTPTQCSGCHMAAYNRTTNPNHVAAGFPQDCSLCHTTTQWKGARFDHNTATKFPLTGFHTGVACQQCHVNGKYAGTPAQCAGCHLPDYNKTTNPNHVTAGFPQDCSLCHTTTQWKGAKFNHNTATKFALTGSHVSVACAQCHANNKYAGTPAQCSGCHMANYNKTTNPNHAAAGFPQDCSLCHTTTQWKGATFNHNTATKFPLSGSHTSLACAQCHLNSVYKGTPAVCSGCHMPAYNKTTNPNHAAAGFPQDCSLCHTTTQWKGATFNHNTATKFPLTGSHTSLPCARCHVNSVYKGTPALCSGCHLANYNKTTNPNHVAAGFPQDCSLCHTTTQWKGATFNHSTATKFALTGFHTSVACAQCHVSNVYRGTPAVCSGCHMPAYNKTTNPNHAAAGFPQDCSLCHTTTQWKGATFNHNIATKFPLTGFHTSVACAQCHVNNVYRGTPALCSGCHLGNYNKTTNPNHVAAGFSQDCSLCHTTTQWKGATFNHSTATRFPLTGSHTSVACAQCHVNNIYRGTPAVCSGCHLANYNRTTNPNHVTAGFPQDCSLCHTTTRWQGATFNHNTATKFLLTGFHTSVACAQCHVNNIYKGTPTQCSGCHLANYNRTTNPNHVAAGFPQDCSLCHTTTQWKGATFNHNTATRFPLTGFHTSVACAQCHVNNIYRGTPTLCSGCHLANFNKTTNPNHVTAGFPTDCSICHTTSAWTPASFDHSKTKFPLTGVHRTTLCVSCHIGGKFAGTPADCYSCHQKVFNSTTNPNHVAAGFPRDCSTCHTTTAWAGARFNHTKFPIYSGSHSGKWTSCGDCHTNSSNYTVFSCLNCHEHEKTRMDQKHQNNRNYVYNSANCYSCHPAGRAG